MTIVYFIDFEAFQCGQEPFTVKELCVMEHAESARCIYHLYKPPKQWHELSEQQRRTYSYEEHRLHHLSWNEGIDERFCGECLTHEMIRMFPNIFSDNAICYVLGRQKCDFLRKTFPHLNLCVYPYANSRKELPPPSRDHVCIYRNHGREHCAYIKCHRMCDDYNTL